MGAWAVERGQLFTTSVCWGFRVAAWWGRGIVRALGAGPASLPSRKHSSGRLTVVFTKQPYPGRKTGWDTDHICYSGHSATSSFSGSLSPSGRSPNSGAVWTTDPPPVVSARLGQRFLSKGRGRHLQLCWPREVSALLLSHESSHRRSANG